MDSWRNITRRKGRSILTIGGVFVGILALTILGAMAEKVNTIMRNNEEFFAAHIVVSPRGSAMGIGGGEYLTDKQIEQLKTIPGVLAVTPRLNMLIHMEGGYMFQAGLPPMIQAVDLTSPYNNWANVRMNQGSSLGPDDKGWVVLGADLGDRFKARVGEMVNLNGKDFLVKGIAEKTLSGPDSMALINIEDGREMLIASNPQLQTLSEMSLVLDRALGEGLDLTKLASSATVMWETGFDADELGERIGREIQGVQVISPGETRQIVRQAMLVINLIILGAAGIALLVGSLSVVNTMFMAISERTQEIGVKMAIGARTGQILREYLMEAALIGFIGGVVGIVVGSIFVGLANRYTRSMGVEIFLVSERLVVFALVLATILGVLAGLYPAYRASQTSCVKALKGE